MSYEAGSIGTRMFFVPRPLPQNAVERFAALAMPPLESLGDGVIHGWVTGRHALDRNLTDDSATYGGHLRLALGQAEKKVPESLLRAECRMEELAQMSVQGVDRLGGSARREIRRSVEVRLMTHAQPVLKTIPFVYDARSEILWAGALSDKQLDAFQAAWAQAMGFSLLPATPEVAAMKLASSNVRDWQPVSFSPDHEGDEVMHDAGADFLTWLWFVSEALGGVVKIEDVGEVAVLIEGPLQFCIEGGGGARDVAIRNGEPMLASATKAALMAGGKPVLAKVTLATGERAYTFTLSAQSFVFRGLKLPDGEALDAISKFQERIDALDELRRMFFGLYARYVTERTNQVGRFNDPRMHEIRQWVRDRQARG